MFFTGGLPWVFNTTGETIDVGLQSVPPGGYLSPSIYPNEAEELKKAVKEWHKKYIYNNSAFSVSIPQHSIFLNPKSWIKKDGLSLEAINEILAAISPCVSKQAHNFIEKDDLISSIKKRKCECGAWAVKDELHSKWCPDCE